MGKTSLAASMALNMLNQSKRSVLYYTLVWDAKDLVKRVLSTSGKITNYKFRHSCYDMDDALLIAESAYKLASEHIHLNKMPASFIDELCDIMKSNSAHKNNYLDEKDAFAIAESASKLAATNFYIEDTPAKFVEQLCEEVKSFSAHTRIDVIFIDALQLMRSTNVDLKGLECHSFILSELNSLAKELGIAIIIMDQLSRSYRTSKRPEITDFRYHESNEKHADTILFIHRESYYLEKNDDRYEAEKDRGEIVVAKHCHCSNEVIPVRWDAKYTCFSNPVEVVV